MTRSLSLTLILLLLATLGVASGVAWLISKDQAALVEQFGRERRAQLLEATHTVEESVNQIADDLRFATELISQPGSPDEHRRELRALLEAVGQYKAIAVYSSDGLEQVRLVDRRAPMVLNDPTLLERLRTTSREALRVGEDAVVISPALGPEGTGWVRAFARAWPSDEESQGGAIAVLVDTEPSFAALRLLTADPDAKMLVLGAYGTPIPTSDPRLVSWYQRVERGASHTVPLFANVLRRMRASEAGVVRLDDGEASQLGLGDADAVATFAPIQVKGGGHWHVVVVASTRILRTQQHTLIVRFSLAAVLVVSFLGAFATYALLANRRAVALREAQRHATRLAHLHEKTQKILDHIPTGVIALDADGRITSINEALRTRLPAEIDSRSLSSTFASAAPGVAQDLERLVGAAAAANDVRSLHGVQMQLFGDEGHYNLHAVPLRLPDADVRMLLVIEDLSALRSLEGQLVQAEKLATVGVLAAGIAHEIGTPLGVVRGHAEYILGKLGAEHAQAPGLRTIVEQIDRVGRTLRQLLDFSRPQAAHVRATDLHSHVQSLRQLLDVEAQRKAVELQLELPHTLPLLAADPDQLEQVLVNLALNAIDACGERGWVRISAGAKPDGEGREVEISVEDNGCGVAPEHLHQVFDPFFTTKKRGQGTGLGLTVVAQIVRSHGGRVELTSEAGKGSCVRLSWPAASAADLRGMGAWG